MQNMHIIESDGPRAARADALQGACELAYSLQIRLHLVALALDGLNEAATPTEYVEALGGEWRELALEGAQAELLGAVGDLRELAGLIEAARAEG